MDSPLPDPTQQKAANNIKRRGSSWDLMWEEN